MTNMELTHPGVTELIDRGVLGAARSLIPGCLSAIDKTMEETFMRFAKGSGNYFDTICSTMSILIYYDL